MSDINAPADPKRTTGYRAAKGAVIVLSALIILALIVLVVGIGMKMSGRSVHRGGVPMYLTPGVDFYRGDVRNRDLLANLLRRVDAVYHFAAYQDYLTDFSRFPDVNVVSTALIYEIIVAEHLDISRVVVAWPCSFNGTSTPS